MKLYAKVLMALLVLALLAPFTILKNDQGNTMLSFSDISLPSFDMPEISAIPDAPVELVPTNMTSGRMDKFYKWYDAEGNVQFTTEPPPEGTEYVVKEYDPDTNLIQAVDTKPELFSSTPAGEGATTIAPTEQTTEETQAYSPESIEKLFEDTKNIQKLLNDRALQQEALNQ